MVFSVVNFHDILLGINDCKLLYAFPNGRVVVIKIFCAYISVR